MRPSQIPPPHQGDHEDVHWALSTAASLQASGEHDEALRWVRRAVAAAVASDDDARAIELGRFAAELEESLAGAVTQRGDDDLDQPTDSGHGLSERKTPRVADMRIDDEVTVVPFTMKAAGLDPTGEALRARRLASKTLKVDEIPFRSPNEAPTRRFEVPGADTIPEPPDAVSSKPAPSSDGMFEDDEPTIASRPRLDLPAASSSTMPALTRWRVALLATADDDQPRVLYLGPGVEPPAGAAVAFLVPCSDEDARAVAALLHRRR